MTISTFDQFCSIHADHEQYGHLLENGILFAGAGAQAAMDQQTGELHISSEPSHKYGNATQQIIDIFKTQFPQYNAPLSWNLLNIILHVPETRSCLLHNTNDPHNLDARLGNGTLCPRFTDTYHCWHRGTPNTTYYLPCPGMYRNDTEFENTAVTDPGLVDFQSMSKTCREDGTWSMTDFRYCADSQTVVAGMKPQTEEFEKLIGYGVFVLNICAAISLVCTLVAVGIFTTFR